MAEIMLNKIIRDYNRENLSKRNIKLYGSSDMCNYAAAHVIREALL